MDRTDPQLDFEGLSRRDHPDTAKEAAIRVEPRTGTQRQKVLSALVIARRHGAGLTDEEIQDVCEMAQNTERPRRVELVNMRWVRDSGRRRKTRSGTNAIVWEYTTHKEADEDE